MAVAVCCMMLLTACVEDDNSSTSPVPEPQTAEKNYVERWVPVVDPKGEAQGTVMLRFYDDMPSVAYINVSYFQTMMYPGTAIQTQALGEGRYQLTSPCGTAVVNTDKDTFDSDDYEAFTNMMDMVQPGMPNISLDGLPLVRWKSKEATRWAVCSMTADTPILALATPAKWTHRRTSTRRWETPSRLNSRSSTATVPNMPL